MSESRKRTNPFITQIGSVKKRKLPESCIESCETILRIHHNPKYKFGGLGQGSAEAEAPPMMLTLKNGGNSTSKNVSDSDSDDTLRWCEGKQSMLEESFSLNKLLLGQGVAFVNSGKKDEEYNMHFLAVMNIDQHNGNVLLSDVSDPGEENMIKMTEEHTVKAKTIGELRKTLGDPYTKKNFIAGKVTLATGAMEPGETGA